jgi:hypothetical protein
MDDKGYHQFDTNQAVSFSYVLNLHVGSLVHSLQVWQPGQNFNGR